jgi:1,4-alpha-glucan branching enzyme
MTALVRASNLKLLMDSANLMAGVVRLDPWLAPFEESLRRRYTKAQDWITAINQSEGGLEKFSRVCDPIPSLASHILTCLKGKEKFGLNIDKQNNITYREWAPNATEAFLIGEFSISLLFSHLQIIRS